MFYITKWTPNSVKIFLMPLSFNNQHPAKIIKPQKIKTRWTFFVTDRLRPSKISLTNSRNSLLKKNVPFF